MSRTVRDVHNGQSRLARYRAERLLRAGFPRLRSKVLAIVRSKLRAAGVWLDQAELEACYSQAWHGLYSQVLAGEAVESPEAWLALVTFRRAIDEARSASRARPGAGEDVASDESRAAAVESDPAGALDDHAQLRSLFEALRSTLSTREREAASLCYLQGLSRADAAAQLGISERRMRKLMEGPGGGAAGVAGKVSRLLETIQAGGWCEQQSSLMRAYAFGILDPGGERHALAVAHTRQCPACRAHVAALRGLASVLPPLPLALALRPGRGQAASKVRGAPHRLLRRVTAARPRLGSGASGWLSEGRLVTQVAVSGVLAIGGGYALLSSRAHGGALHRHGGGAASLLERTVSAPAELLAGHSRPARGHARPSPKGSRADRVSASHRSAAQSPRVGPPSQEFSPERTPGQPPATGSSAAAPGQNEFGFEGR